MASLRVFLFEDHPSDYLRFQASLQNAFSLIKDGAVNKTERLEQFEDVRIDRFATFEEARRNLEASVAEYNLLVFDILQAAYANQPAEEQAPVGDQLAAIARAKQAKPAILFFSATEQQGHAGIRSKVEQIGKLPHAGRYGTHGCRFIQKVEVLNNPNFSIHNFAEILLELLVDANQIARRPIPLEIVSDVSGSAAQKYLLQSALEMVGEERLKELVAAVTGLREGVVKVYYVAPGLSGASVLRLEYDLGGHPRNLLLKISQNRESLEKELDRVPKPGDALRWAFVNYVVEGRVRSSDDGQWYAIAADFFVAGQTLRRYLAQATHQDTVDRLMHTLFVTHFKEAYRRAEAHANFYNSIHPLPSRGARAYAALEEFDALARIHGNVRPGEQTPVVGYDANVLRVFLEDKDAEWSTLLRDQGVQATRCWSHGDLHAGNIMASKNGEEVRVIDPAELGMHFWATDLARLTVDLVATCWDQVVDDRLLVPSLEAYREARLRRPYEWDALEDWRILSDAICSGTEEAIRAAAKETACPPNQGLLWAILWTRKNLGAVHGNARVGAGQGSGPGWQFQLALGIEFLRASYRETLPVTKRVLGLMAAHDALRSCRKYLRGE